MMLATTFLIMQFIISAKAGLVNAVEGTANVRLQQQVEAGSPIQTDSTGRVEVMLNPGTFLRLGEDSQAVLDSVELADIRLRILSGSAMIDAGTIEKDSPIRVMYGHLKVSIVAPGLYRFSEGAASVLEGELRTEDSAVSINKGWQIKTRDDQTDQYEEAKIPSPALATPLDQWNQQRSQQIASANARSSETDSASNSLMPAYQAPFVYPGGILPYRLPPGFVPPATSFSFFDWYYGGYGFYQPFSLYRPLFIYPPFAPRHPGVIVRPLPSLPRPPTLRPGIPTPPSPSRPVPSRPGGGISPRGRR